MLDLVALQTVPEAESVLRYLRSIILERGDYNGRVLSIRRDDLRAICSLLRTDEPDHARAARGVGRARRRTGPNRFVGLAKARR